MSNHPEFFDQQPAIVMRDPLAEILGAAEHGVMTYHYADAVRLAGHSCPTVAGAWLMARRGLSALYPEEIPERGGIRVELRAAQHDGVSGVVGSVLGLITGAAGEGGFKGLGGRYDRRGLLRYGVVLPSEVRMTRLDTGMAVLLDYYPDRVAGPPELAALLARIVGGAAGPEERSTFARLWQERVRRILNEEETRGGLVALRPVA